MKTTKINLRKLQAAISDKIATHTNHGLAAFGLSELNRRMPPIWSTLVSETGYPDMYFEDWEEYCEYWIDRGLTDRDQIRETKGQFDLMYAMINNMWNSIKGGYPDELGLAASGAVIECDE